jgi:hypothetical protein
MDKKERDWEGIHHALQEWDMPANLFNKKEILDDPWVDGKMIIKSILGNQVVSMWTGQN